MALRINLRNIRPGYILKPSAADYGISSPPFGFDDTRPSCLQLWMHEPTKNKFLTASITTTN